MDVFTEMDVVLEGIGAMMAPAPAPLPPIPMPPASAFPAPAFPAPAFPASSSPARPLTEPESLALLRGFGVPTVPTIICHSVAEAQAAADKMGWPVVLKGVADGVAHKSDLGLVHVGLRDAGAVAKAHAAAGCATVVVQPMISGELEAIAGVTRADGVGLVLLAGLGGIHAEALRDVTMWPLPVAQETVESGLRTGALGRVLYGARWKHAGTAAAFVDVLMGLQTAALALGDRLQAIDVNPVILGASGAIAVDALIVPTS